MKCRAQILKRIKWGMEKERIIPSYVPKFEKNKLN